MSDYLLGDEARERARLGFQHEAWSASTSALWDRAGFALGHRIADLGCGPGFATLPLARRVGPSGQVLAVDASAASLRALEDAALELPQVEVRRTALESLELPSASFDGLFARWVFCFLSNPQALVRRAAAWLKPGGTFAILDYFQYEALALAPTVEMMGRVREAVMKSWSASGGDLSVGGKLPAMCEAEGLEVVDIRPIVHCARPGSALWQWPATFFEGFLSVLVEGEFLSAEDAQGFRDALDGHARLPGAYLLTPPVIAIVCRKR